MKVKKYIDNYEMSKVKLIKTIVNESLYFSQGISVGLENLNDDEIFLATSLIIDVSSAIPNQTYSGNGLGIVLRKTGSTSNSLTLFSPSGTGDPLKITECSGKFKVDFVPVKKTTLIDQTRQIFLRSLLGTGNDGRGASVIPSGNREKPFELFQVGVTNSTNQSIWTLNAKIYAIFDILV